ncbi:MAG TPA: succinate dehydrogenase assembly factor 2 [Sedimenticola sp.]|nr:succinate dehydrogenase assembly factor 2 [Sedimenticola sp.]
MLELDLILEGFLDRGYDALTPAQQRAFARMLQFEDPLLLDWFMGYAVPADGEIGGLVERITGGGRRP